jgi:hypothetical protein
MIDGQWIEFEEVGQGYYHEERGTIWMDNETCTEWKSPGDYSLAKELGDLDDWYGGEEDEEEDF